MVIVEYVNNRICSYGTGTAADLLPSPSAVTVGSFDGIHLGHRRIIAKMLSIARERSLRSVVVTFEPHPRKVLKSEEEASFGLLCSLEEKIGLLSSLDVDLLFIVRFTREFAARSSEDFIRHVLFGILGARNVVVGYDHGFGNRRSGSGKTLSALGGELGFQVEVIDEVRIAGEHISSTRIRKLLESGMIAEANALLGSAYMLSGRVVHGDKRGRLLGFPTVNIELADPDKLLPKSGVYAARTTISGISMKAMLNIGFRPTISADGPRSIEAHILDYNGSLYGNAMLFSLDSFIREERRFASLEELRVQLEKDKKTVESYC
ncbi:MAG: bifunctional riboflavin kinase/FAD synthetase [Chlorobiaceae bacterium]|nr:bifunctional riboflavin kinase/FAD synthetase [Chlorobiaceae bacterium]NTV61259.1 bifunctional riboflavin kinase/FAD synthetase [Chlorobiaceae bacterium]